LGGGEIQLQRTDGPLSQDKRYIVRQTDVIWHSINVSDRNEEYFSIVVKV